jgi:DNA modification methylase
MTVELTEITATAEVHCVSDCLAAMKLIPDDQFDLVFCSPPYSDARTYGVGFNLRGDDWVDWAFERYMECVRVCRGLVCWVVEGRTRKFQWDK